MDALTRWLLYILAAYMIVVLGAVAAGFLIGWLTRGAWRRTRALIEQTLGPRGEDDTDDGGLTAILDIVREDLDGPTQELRPVHPVYAGRRRRREDRLSDSYINGEDYS